MTEFSIHKIAFGVRFVHFHAPPGRVQQENKALALNSHVLNARMKTVFNHKEMHYAQTGADPGGQG